MGQNEIIKLLKGKDWMSVSELSKICDINRTSISENVRRLYKHNEIEKRLFIVGYRKVPKYRLVVTEE